MYSHLKPLIDASYHVPLKMLLFNKYLYVKDQEVHEQRLICFFKAVTR
jgi:hypothetical protein